MKLNSLSQLTVLTLLGLYSSGLAMPSAHADIVQATYEIVVSDFLNSNNESPPAPTSNELSGTVAFTYDTTISQKIHIVPDAVTGFSMTDNDGNTINYNAQNSGINTFNNAVNGNHRITFGGLPQVEFMTGLSEDMRIVFDISPTTYEIQNVSGVFSFVTTVDPFYQAQNNSVELVSLTVFPDTDADGIEDAADNCLLVANVDQRDTNADNIGNACDPDFSQDCIVNYIDLAIFGNNFLLQGDLDTDLNGDGATNFADLNILTSRFFMPPGPSGLSNSCSP